MKEIKKETTNNNNNSKIKEDKAMKKNEEFIREYVNSKSIYYFYTTLLKEIKRRELILNKYIEYNTSNIDITICNNYAHGINKLKQANKEIYKMYKNHLENNGETDELLKNNIIYMFLNEELKNSFRWLFLENI